jgi:DNA-binding NarL/FixJ family response regulator
MVRVLIADDHGLYRRGLRALLEKVRPDIEVLEAMGMDDALAQLTGPAKVDLAIVDLHMNGELSQNILKEVGTACPQTSFIIISASRTRADVLRALDAGMDGFVSKSQSDEEIVTAISDVLSGRIYVPPLLLKSKGGEADEINAPSLVPATGAATAPHKLTPRQRDVLALVADGLSNKEIARALKIAEATTKIHVAALMRALGVRNRTEAAVRVKSWLNEQKLEPRL